MPRFIGIKHRVKQTKEGEARPTMVAIKSDDRKVVVYELKTERDELDLLLGRFPTEWRALEDGEAVEFYDPKKSPGGFRVHQCKWRRVKDEEDASKLDERRMFRIPGDGVTYLMKVPCQFDGVRSGDTVGMMLGGSGDLFASALSRRGESFGATVWRITPSRFKEIRGEASKDDDHLLLADLIANQPTLFHLMRLRDRDGIRVREALDIRQQAMKARIGCEQRLRQSFFGRIFLSEEGHYPEGEIEKEFDAQKASDEILQRLIAEEARRDKELALAVRKTGIWKDLFKDITGCGERITAGLIAPIGDIRRFWQEPDPVKMDALYERSRKLEEDGQLRLYKRFVKDRIRPEMTPFQILQIVRTWQARNGMPVLAAMLTEAIECHVKRHELRQKARRRGESKLKAFCGVHLVDGKFARRRAGKTSNWSPGARQSLWLLGDQFTRWKKSEWGMKFLENKLKLREAHPVPIEEVNASGNMVKRYTNGHIHKMAMWRTLSQFVVVLYREWTRIEERAQKNSSEPENEAA